MPYFEDYWAIGYSTWNDNGPMWSCVSKDRAVVLSDAASFLDAQAEIDDYAWVIFYHHNIEGKSVLDLKMDNRVDVSPENL